MDKSIVSLDPIRAKKTKGPLARLLVTRYGGGSAIIKMDQFGHYMFCGPQGSGKTASALWYIQKLTRKYGKKGYKVRVYSNVDVGEKIQKKTIFDTINGFDPTNKEIRIIFIDEIQSYFPRGTTDKDTQKIMFDLVAVFSQLRKRSTYVISTAQVYGRLDKSLREQCLYMVQCSVSLTNKLVNDFIPGDDIICDDLGRWSGDPKYIYKHGLSKIKYNTKKIIRD